MRILVTGGAGYVGCICAEILLARGHEVLVLDSLVEGHRAAISPSARFAQCDLLNAIELDRVLSSFHADATMHFAAEAEVEKSVRLPSLFYKVNVAGGIQLLDSMLRHGVRKIVFSSTAAVYGEPSEVPIPEDHAKNPINPYGQSKLTFERVLDDYARYTGIQYVSLRYFNAAGASAEHGEAHRNESHIIPRILEVAAAKRSHIDVCGSDYPTPDGTCLRDYVHVLDIAQAHVLALDAIDSVSGEAFNVGNSRGYSILEVLAEARRITAHPIPAKFAARRPGDPATLVASSEKIKTRLGWNPENSSLSNIVESAWRWKKKFPMGYIDS